MSDYEPNGEPTPGWPSPPAPGSGTPTGPATPPPAASPTPPPGYAPPPQPGYAPPGYTPPGYAPPTAAPPPGYGYGYANPGYQVARDHPQGTLILVLGILSIVVCGLLGPVAWYMGNKAIKEIDANPSAYSNRGNVQAGRIIGIVASCLLILGVVIYGLVIIAVIAGGTSSS